MTLPSFRGEKERGVLLHVCVWVLWSQVDDVREVCLRGVVLHVWVLWSQVDDVREVCIRGVLLHVCVWVLWSQVGRGLHKGCGACVGVVVTGRLCTEVCTRGVVLHVWVLWSQVEYVREVCIRGVVLHVWVLWSQVDDVREVCTSFRVLDSVVTRLGVTPAVIPVLPFALCVTRFVLHAVYWVPVAWLQRAFTTQ